MISKQIRFGTAMQTYQDDDMLKTVLTAKEVGYPGFDTSDHYPRNDEILEVLKDKYISHKVWVDQYHEVYNLTFRILNQNKKPALEQLLIHWPLGKEEDIKSCYKDMISLKTHGIIRHIGLSNVDVEFLEWFKSNFHNYDVDSIQIELHPGHQQKDVIDYIESYFPGTSIEAYSTMARGSIANNNLILAMSDRLKLTPNQLMVLWCKAKGYTPIIKTTKKERMIENYYAYNNLRLNKSDVETLDTLEGKLAWSERTLDNFTRQGLVRFHSGKQK